MNYPIERTLFFRELVLYGASVLCGVGFTMSLFIGSLAFEETGVNLVFDERLGIISGSIASGLVGFLVLRFSLISNSSMQPTATASAGQKR